MALTKRSDDPTKGEDHEESLVDNAVGDQEERIGLMVAAIDELDVNNDEDFTDSGKPRVEALEAASGISEITATERDTAWENYNG